MAVSPPADWAPARLGELGECVSGGTPPTSDPRFWGGELPWVTSKDMKVARLIGASDHVTPLAIGNGTRLVQPGTILMVVRGMSLAHTFPVGLAERELAFNQDLKAFIATPHVVPAYLLRWLEGNQASVLRLVTDSTHGTKRLPMPDLLAVVLHLPSAVEQRAIAETLGDMERLIESLETLIAKKRAIRHAAMQQLLTGRTRLPGFSEAWALRRLGEHVRFLRHGTLPRSALTSKGEVVYLHYGDIHNSTAVLLGAGLARLPSLPRKAANRLDRLENGDLVMVDASEDLDGVGKSVEIVERHGRDVVAGLHTIAARFDDAVLATGFKGYLQFVPEFRRHLRRLAAGTKVYATNRSHIQSAEVRLPGLEEQRAIGAMLSDMDSELESLEQRLAKTRAIKEGAMQQLLTGRIRLPLDRHGGRTDEDVDA